MYFSKIAKVKTIYMSDTYSDEKINVMLNSGWKILDSYKIAYENDIGDAGGSNLYYILGHEDSQAQIPLTKREINKQKEREEFSKQIKERIREFGMEFGGEY